MHTRTHAPDGAPRSYVCIEAVVEGKRVFYADESYRAAISELRRRRRVSSPSGRAKCEARTYLERPPSQSRRPQPSAVIAEADQFRRVLPPPSLEKARALGRALSSELIWRKAISALRPTRERGPPLVEAGDPGPEGDGGGEEGWRASSAKR